jgi:hypothetical protein
MYRQEPPAHVVGAGLGQRCDWYRNILAEPDVIVIAQDESWVKPGCRAYHRHPSHHISVSVGHNWRTLSRVLHVQPRQLGDEVYQIEQLLRIFRATAAVLMIHAKTTTTGDQWEADNRELTCSFLGIDSLPDGQEWTIGKASIRR